MHPLRCLDTSVSGDVQVGQYLAVPFVFNERREKTNETILNGLARLPLFPLPLSVDERKVAAASFLTDPDNLVWEVWRGSELVGILSLSRILRGLDAVGHFAFFDRQLLGRRQLVLAMLRWAFRELDLQRLSVEIPDHLEPLIRFARTKLGFRYEGERLAEAHPVVTRLPTSINGPARWIARWGARREHAHFDGEQWHDIVLLRLLREEVPMS